MGEVRVPNRRRGATYGGKNFTLLQSDTSVGGWELSPLPSTLFYHITTHVGLLPTRVYANGTREEFLLARSPGGPVTDHPCSLPASPEASDKAKVC